MVRPFWGGIVAVVATLAVVGSGSGQRVAFSRWSSVGRLSVPKPAGFSEVRWAKGVAIGDLSRQELGVPDLESGRGFPTYRDGAFLIVREATPVPNPGGPSQGPTTPPPPRLRLPLSLGELGAPGYAGHWWSGGFVSGACTGNCDVVVWIGPKAPAADRAALLEALASITRERAAT